MSGAYDLIVIGAGHNGLTTAALSAAKGRKVLVLEQREACGGLAASIEFHPGYRSAGLFHDSGGVRPWIVESLGLAGLGLKRREHPPRLLALGNGDGSLLLGGPPETAAAAIAERRPEDGEAFLRFGELNRRLRPVLLDFFDRPPLDLIRLERPPLAELLRRGVRLRRLGREPMMELLRLPPGSIADWLGEWFADDLLKSALALPALAGGFAGPRSPGTTTNLLLHLAVTGPGIVGGGPALVSALEHAATARGAEIRTGARVAGILTDGEGVRGVRLASGETIDGRKVAASCDPRQLFLDLLEPGAVSTQLSRDLRQYRCRGTTAQVLLALDEPLRFAQAGGEPTEFACTGGHLNDLERAFDAVKYRRFSKVPILEIHQPTIADPELAPRGHAVVSILVHFAPHNCDGGWGDDTCQRLERTVLELLEGHAPGLQSTIVGAKTLSPVALEHQFGLTGGQIHHGEQALDQLLVRPVPGCAGYRSPIPGLHPCGSGSHPGGGLTCAPGALAAGAIGG